MNEIAFRKANPLDVVAIADLESLCFKNPWTTRMIESEMADPHASFYLGELNGKVVSYFGFLQVLDELQILNIAVDPMYQNMGIGKKMLEYFDSIARKMQIRAATLEVRESNIPAIHLYEKVGFHFEGTRPRYYMDNEDARIYWKIY